jgi:hypothetical protein
MTTANGGTVIPDGVNGVALILAFIAIGFVVLIALLVLIRGRENPFACRERRDKPPKKEPPKDA